MIRVLLPLLFLMCLSLQAQDNTYTYIEYDSINNGFLELKLDKKMDDLLEAKKSRCGYLERIKVVQEKEDKPVAVADLCRQYPKMKGYRIQVVNTRSSDEAEKANQTLQMQFPELSSNVVLRYPQFKVLMGDYFSKQNAASDLTRVKRMYPGALLVVSKIWCNRAK